MAIARTVGIAAAGVLALCAGRASAGGTGANLVIIADPLNAESMYVANYYRAARGVPDSNVFYFSPGADDYQSFVAWNLAALRALVAERGLAGQADYLVLMPGAPFYIGAEGLVSDSCSPVRRFSISGAYTTAFVADEVLAGVNSSFRNQFSRNTFEPRPFDSEAAYFNGEPSNDSGAKRYYLGAMLGYTGERGNTLQEVLDNIDRSVAADFSRPAGTFYFCQTTDDARSAPRHNSYPSVVDEIIRLGGSASHEFRQMPRNRQDVMSVLTGAANVDIPNANVGILAGAYADHLTSFGAMFDNPNQMKIAEWIRNGATASHGTVEEPCNYPGKFVHARSMVYYYQGATMGESLFRALGFTPFQGLIYGDPMCRAFDYEVAVSLVDAPTGPVSGVIELSPAGQTDKPGHFVLEFAVAVDNRVTDEDFILPLEIDTTEFADGWHELRAFGYDTSPVRSTGEWVGELVVSNLGRSAGLDLVGPGSGDHSTVFTFDASSLAGSFGSPVEIRLVQHGRVLASAPECGARLRATGLQLGAGTSRVQAEALFADGMRVRSAPVEVSVAYTDGTPSGSAPEVFTSTAWVGDAPEAAVTLPYFFDDRNDGLSFEVVEGPAQATIVPGPNGPVLVVEPDAGASGYDVVTYRASAAAGQSALGRVVLVYDHHPLDLSGDGAFDIEDLYEIHSTPRDVNFDGVADGADVRELERLLRCGELRDMDASR